MGALAKNATLSTTDKEQIKVIPFSSSKLEIGEGGQGIVYKVAFRNGEYALKWYSHGVGKDSKAFYENLKYNVKNGTPANTFLWPLAVTNIDANGCFGYVMNLRPKEFVDFPKILNAKANFASIDAIINAALKICASFKVLHGNGLSYQDLNDGNFFINTTTGDVLICDNDNVTSNTNNLGIKGKFGYMAPEIVCPDNTNLPDKYSDRFSLAIVLFLLLFRDHPLKGLRDDGDDISGESDLNLFCYTPIFIFDPKDASNRPKPGIHVNAQKFWDFYPPFIKEAFIKSFDKKVMKANGEDKEDRLRESEWCKEFIWLKNSLMICPECKQETFFPMKHKTGVCLRCKKEIHRPPVLVLIKKREITIPLYENAKIYIHEVNEQESDYTPENITKVIGVVVRNKKDPNIYGIKNLSDFPWYRRTPGGKDITCNPGDGVVIAENNTIKFGTFTEWVIEY